MRRRTFVGAGLGALTIGRFGLARADPARFDEQALVAGAAAAEALSGGRLGAALVEIGTARRWSWRGAERFPMCSTFKILLAAAVLARADRGEESLERRVAVTPAGLVENSPFASARSGADAAVAELAEAAVTLGDNTAANLLLPSIGGPEGLTRFCRSIGDPDTRLDRIEPALNESAPGDPRDTTTPDAMAASVGGLVFGETLTPSARGRLVRWLIDSRTGAARLRGGLPGHWDVGGKTGGGAHGTANDVAVLWPPDRPPLVLACYLTQSRLDGAGRDAIHVDVARAVAEAVDRD